jgi:hypothetical protein
MKMKKTVIKALDDSRVEMSYTDSFTGERREYYFYAPASGGYVRYGPNNKQICEKLSFAGPTLQWSGKSPLVNLIRREYRAMRAAERREMER